MGIIAITFRNYRSFGNSGITIPLTHQHIGLIGVNNSGKSSVLRAFYELKSIFGWLGSNEVVNVLNELLGGGSYAKWVELAPGERVFPARDDHSEPQIQLDFDDAADDHAAIKSIIISLAREGKIKLSVKLWTGESIRGVQRVENQQVSGRNVAQAHFSEGRAPAEFYWEGASKEFQSLSRSMYIGPFRNVLDMMGGQYYDLLVGRHLIERLDQEKNGPDFVRNERFRAALGDLANIFGMRSLDVGASPDRTQLVFNVDGKSFRGTELGAGIAQFVIVAVSVLSGDPAYLLIDEPESNLHASLQARFLSLLSTSVSHSVIFATHSLGLARSQADRLIVITRSADGTSFGRDFQAIKSLSVTLGELGYGGLQDSKYRAVLLVEGVSDVKAYRELLRSRGIRDEVVIVPLGGDDMAGPSRDVELAELARLSEKVFAIVDSEQETSDSQPAARRIAFQKSCVNLGIDCHILTRRALENYLDDSTARKIFNASEDAPALGDYGKPDESWGWSKERNWLVAREMTRASLDETDLGVALDRIVEALDNKPA